MLHVVQMVLNFIVLVEGQIVKDLLPRVPNLLLFVRSVTVEGLRSSVSKCFVDAGASSSR